ncbi:MAG: 5-oxoprolinase subunit B family protein [Candidatus Hecatellaceae archaeon]
MSVKSEAVIDVLPQDEKRAFNVIFRYAGDEWIVMDYDVAYQKVDLLLNLRIMAVDQELKKRIKEGLIETIPGFRAALTIHYDPKVLPLKKLVDELKQIESEMVQEEITAIPSRHIELPITFRDSKTTEYIQWYAKYVRSDAPNIINNHNIEYIALCNGISVEELIDLITLTDWWTVTIGFWPGLPFLLPIDPRCMISVPKYNPTRPRTPEFAVGIGGPCVAIYPIESPGGYQLFGRTIPIFDVKQRNPAYKDNPVLLKPGDRIRFVPVPEEKLLEIIEKVYDGTYRYRIIDYEYFNVARYTEFLEEVKEEAEAFRRKREEAARKAPVP